ncbi:unnamed protein product [Rhizophagus irregularis]|uniref:Uncharacterized protein n=1 Tax=Rhizophagus irregularis TaxID=588596 RepID=A0A2I1H5T4_9GLOM|nr:hypothetical protein RhiirA4_472912 [Rhizophagus irregularis]CAB4436412.1 unnamed protein product [Rhizophagus irregularis]
MLDIYKIINSLLEKEETKKLQIHLINHPEKEEKLLLALRSHNSKDKQSLLKYFLEIMSSMLSNNFIKSRYTVYDAMTKLFFVLYHMPVNLDEHKGLCVVMISQLEHNALLSNRF